MFYYLHSHIAHDGSLVSLQGLCGNHADLTLSLAHKLLAGGMKHLLILSLDLYLIIMEEEEVVVVSSRGAGGGV